MAGTRRGIIAWGSMLIGFALAGPSSFAQSPTPSLQDKLVGSWQLVSVGLDHTSPYGDNPQGFMSLDAAGHFSVIVISAGQAKNISYYGTYTVNDADSSMTIHIAGSSHPHETGRDLKRVLAFTGDELVVQSSNGNVKLTWKRSS